MKLIEEEKSSKAIKKKTEKEKRDCWAPGRSFLR